MLQPVSEANFTALNSTRMSEFNDATSEVKVYLGENVVNAFSFLFFFLNQSLEIQTDLWKIVWESTQNQRIIFFNTGLCLTVFPCKVRFKSGLEGLQAFLTIDIEAIVSSCDHISHSTVLRLTGWNHIIESMTLGLAERSGGYTWTRHHIIDTDTQVFHHV